jgi:dTDP-4-amino-4,6-dideoxygalactose transaminase
MPDQIALGAPTFGDEEIDAVREVLSSGWVAGQGPRVQQFEAAFAAHCGATDAIAVNNCTAALHLALLALGAGAGDEVIVADYTFPATGHAVMFTGAEPVFADVDPVTFCIDVDAVASLIGPRTVGVIAVDVVGQCADYEPLRALTRERGLFLVQDAACSAGATYHGRPAGHPDLADVACFSLHGRKGITCGEGGVVATSDAGVADTVRRLGAFGIESARARAGRDELAIPVFADLGYNYKLSDIAAAIATVQLARLPDLLDARRRAAATYAEAFAGIDGVQAPQIGADRDHTWQSYLLTVDPELSRDHLALALRREGIGANIGTYASHLQPVYGERKPCPVSADIFTRHLAIPMHANLTDDDIGRVVAAVARAIQERP